MDWAVTGYHLQIRTFEGELVAEYDHWDTPEPTPDQQTIQRLQARIKDLEKEIAALKAKINLIEAPEFDKHDDHNCYKLNCGGIADRFWEAQKKRATVAKKGRSQLQ